MTRRSKSSPAEDLIELVELVAMLPWWAGAALALLSYLLLNQIAAQPLTAPAQPGLVSAMFTQALWKGLASAGQYILPVIFLAAAGVSAWRRKVRERLVTDIARSRAGDVLDGIRWREFETLVGEGFRLQGYQVVRTGGGGAYGGVDLVLTRPARNGAEKFFVRCKQWRALKVGVGVVRKLYGVMAARGANAGGEFWGCIGYPACRGTRPIG